MKTKKKHSGICGNMLGMLLLGFLLSAKSNLCAQTSGSINVGGDINTFYPVSWSDGNYSANRNTTLTIARNVHTNSQWRGSMVGEFTYHTNNWGAGSHFIDVKLSSHVTNTIGYKDFVAGWADATASNSDKTIIIWLRGGGTTYYYTADATVNPKVYDGTQNTSPYVSSNGNVTMDVKTILDSYVVNSANSFQLPLNVYGTTSNYMQGNLGIGRRNPTEKLEVNGTIRAKEIKVEAAPWPDYVFAESYDLPSLKETENFIKTNKHLPDMPNAQDVEANGVALGEMNRLLLQKVEELTLHLIEKDKAISVLQEQIKEIDVLKMQLNDVKKTIKTNK